MTMQRDEVLRLLAEHRDELRRRGVKSIALFGSAARGEAGPQSDIDILVEFEASPTFDRYMDVKFYLEDLIGAPVDLVTLRSLKPLIRPVAERGAVYVT